MNEKNFKTEFEKKRFEFGKNWERFLSKINNERIYESEKSLLEKLKINDLTNKSFIDIGSGSGLFSLAAKNLGAQGATINYARGTGIRERMGLLGVTIDEQKEVIRIIVSEDQADMVFEAMYLSGKLDTPGKGIMFMTKLEKVATYIPDSVLKNLD